MITDFLELPRATADLALDTDLRCNENSQHVIDYESDCVRCFVAKSLIYVHAQWAEKKKVW